MAIMTVRGPIEADTLGITLAHEHLFIDLGNQFTPSADGLNGLVTSENLEQLRRNPYALRDNLVLDNTDLAIEEISCFQALGGKAVVDCTCHGINRDVRKLHEVAERTGLHIIAGSGYYTHDTHPPAMDEWTAEQIADEMLHDLLVGIDGTNIKAGIIGEIGTSDPIHPNELKNLQAAALAFEQVEAAVYVHTYPWGKAGLLATETLLNHGVRPQKIVICHTDVELDLHYIRALLKTGVFVEFDNFGKEFCIDTTSKGFAAGDFAQDVARICVLRQLIKEGYEQQLLITNDVCLKTMLHQFGGLGYDHILKNVLPIMESKEITKQSIQTMLVDNPRRLLDISHP